MESTQQPSILQYEQPIPRPTLKSRPRWVVAVVGVYLLVFSALLLAPVLFALTVDDSDRLPFLAATGGTVSLLLLAGLALLIVPVRVVSQRPVSRQKLIWPILGAGFLAALLVAGGALAVCEWGRLMDDADVYGIIAVSACVWVGWAVVFWIISGSKDPAGIGMGLHRKLIAGSVLELLVAVPAHVVVRQRSDCCAGLWTGAGICAGVGVAFLAFGPSVLLLYWKRVDAIRPGIAPRAD